MSAEPTKLEVPDVPDRPESTTSTLRGEDVQEKKEGEELEDVTDGTVDGGDELSEDEYPSGIKMFFIVLALVLSVFLFSLDLVSCQHYPLTTQHADFIARLSLPPLSPRSLKSSRVLTRSAGTAHPSS